MKQFNAGMLKNGKRNSIAMAILAIIYGLILIIWPDLNAKLLGYVIAGAIVLIGLVFVVQYIRKDVVKDFYRRELVWGLTALFVGIVIFLKVDLIIGLLPFILGIIVLISGIVKLQNAFDLVRLDAKNWVPVMILAVINVAFGILLIANPVWIANIIFILIGAGLVYSGISDLITYFLFGRVEKNYMGQNPDIYQEQK